MTNTEKNAIEQNTFQSAANAGSVWNAIHTRPRHEKAVVKQLETRRVEAYLPTFGKVHHWKDRKKLVFVPVFPGYVFVRASRRERLSIVQIAGVVRFVGFGGLPAEISETDLQALRKIIESGAQLEPHRYLRVGQHVRVCRGPLQDTEGLLIRKKNGDRLVLSIDLIQRSLAVEVDAADVEPAFHRENLNTRNSAFRNFDIGSNDAGFGLLNTRT